MIPEVKLGSALVSLLDPTPGEEVAFHRWYERDHFYSGVMFGSWFFAGRRFVATRRLKDLRFPPETPVIDDVMKGSYLALYWITDGRHCEAEAWAVEQVNQLIAQDRMLPSRRQAMAGFYHHRYTVCRDADGVPPELALDHPFAGAILVMVDRNDDVEGEAFDTWCRETYLPARLEGSAAAICVVLEPVPLPDDAPSYVVRPEGLERRSLHLYFVESDPEACWQELVVNAEPERGRISYAAGFIPTTPGSDRYSDELW